MNSVKMTHTDLQTWDQHGSAYLQAHSEKNDLFKRDFDTPLFLSMLGNLQDKKVLDLGCGNGDLCKHMRKRGAHVIGLDGAESMLQEAKKNTPDCDYILCDLMSQSIPFARDYFDIITAKMLLDVVASVEKVSSESLRVLKPEGLYAIEIPHPMRPYIKKNKSRYLGIKDYKDETRGKIKFLDEDFSYYHRSISYYINTIIKTGFILNSVQEVSVDDKFVKRFPDQIDKKIFPTSWQLLFKKM